MTNESYKDLANGIIVQAAKDYRRALRRLRRNPKYESAIETKEEVEQFFHSTWFSTLSDADPDYLLEHIAREGL